MTSDVRRRTAIVSSSLFLVLCVLPLACAPKAPDAKETGVAALPEPRETHFEKSEFVIDDKTILLVTSQATEWTRRAALAIQREVRERYGHDLPLVRIMDQPKMEPRKAIWLVEPRLVRPPDKTIGVRGLNVDEAMFHDSYFIRTDYMEVVIHGTDAAGTWYGAQAFLQLIRPPAPGSLFRKARPITVPRLWIKDFPKDRVRPIPEALGLPSDPKAVEAFLYAAARYRLNALSAKVIPTDADTAAYVREMAARHYIQVLDTLPKSPDCPYAFALAWASHGAAVRYALAAVGEAHWGETDPDAATFLERFARETFGTDGAVEALRLAKDGLDGWLGFVDPASLADAVAKGTVPESVRDQVEAVRRAARGIHAGLEDATASPAVRDAFLAGADRALCNAENSLALLEAGALYKRGKASRALRALQARLPHLEALGDDVGEARKAFGRWVELFEAASQVAKPPSLEELIAKGWRKSPAR